jgi:hypothetical protein
MKPDVGLGDLLRAWDACGRDPDALPLLARAMGYEPRTSTTPPLPSPPEEPPRPTPIAPRERVESRGAPDRDRSETGLVLETLPRAPTPSIPAWRAVSPLPRGTPSPKPLPAPLFPAMRERGLLAAAARTLRDDTGLDVPAVVEALARRILPRPLPRRRVPSLRGGVQLIVDDGAWMAPFADDLARLRVRLREVVGTALEELSVRELPPLVVTAARRAPRPWAPPRPGTAVIVVSDLGRAAWRNGRAGPDAAWSALLADIESAGLAPVVLVPGHAARYRDRGVRRTLMLDWDRSARIAQILQFVRAHR